MPDRGEQVQQEQRQPEEGRGIKLSPAVQEDGEREDHCPSDGVQNL